MVDTEDDDSALAWAGDEKPVTPAAETPVGKTPAAETRIVEVAPPEAKQQIPAPVLVTYGILAGAYLLYTIGWVLSVQRYNDRYAASPEPLNAFMFGLGEVLAILAPALWFAATLLLTRGRKPIIRLLVLLVGLLATLPWPFVLGAWR
jgi:hypothetical protein